MTNAHLLAASLLLGALAAPPATAALSFSFDRISDTEATLTVTGSVDSLAPTGVNIGRFSNLELPGVMTNADAGPADGSVAQNPGISLGSIGIQGWTVLGGDMIAFPNFNFENGDVLTGSSTATITDGNIEWLPVGFTGDVYAEYEPQTSANEGFRGPTKIGTWEIVSVSAVPEPSSLMAFGGIMAAGLMIRRRDRNA